MFYPLSYSQQDKLINNIDEDDNYDDDGEDEKHYIGKTRAAVFPTQIQANVLQTVLEKHEGHYKNY
jgi:hypothetical protein